MASGGAAHRGSSTVTGFSFSAGQLGNTHASSVSVGNNAQPNEVSYDPSGLYVFVPLKGAGSVTELIGGQGGKLQQGTSLSFPAQLATAQPASTTFSVNGATRMYTLMAATSTVTAWAMCYSGSSLSMSSLQEISTNSAVAAPPVTANTTVPAVPVAAAAATPGACSQAVSPNGGTLLVGNCVGAQAERGTILQS
jgi:hypothetical protein